MNLAETTTLPMRRSEIRDAALRRRPRVLHLLTSLEIGGTERQAVELLKRVDRLRWDVRLAVIRREGPLCREIADLYPDVPEFRLTSFHDLDALRQLARLCRLLVDERIEVLHAHDFYSGLMGVVAGRLAGCRVIASQRHLRLSDRRVHRWGSRFILRAADRVIVNCDAIRDQLTRDGAPRPEKIRVIKNGISAAARVEAERERAAASAPGIEPRASARAERGRLCREHRLDPDSLLVGVLARLAPVKGHRVLVEAASSIVRRFPTAVFLLVGDGPARDGIEDLVARLGLRKRVLLLGDRIDAPDLVASFDLLVLPSLHEGLPNAVMEAMSAGVPVVASAVGGVPELIEDGWTGYLTPPGDPAALSSTISAALADRDRRVEIGERGRTSIHARFGIDRVVASVERLYEEITASSNGKARD